MSTLALFGLLLVIYRWGLRPGLVVPTFVAVPLVLAVHAGQLDLQFFTWVKVLTLVVSMLLLVGCLVLRDTTWRSRLALGLFAFLALNILEAVVADAVAGRWPNALVGISLIATLAGPGAIRRSADDRHVLYDIPWPWILCYTVWNLTVVCGIYPEHWTDNLAVLAVPVAAALAWGRERWLEARAFSLSVYACGIVLAVDVYRLPWLPPSPSTQALLPWLSGLAVFLALWNLHTWFSRRRTGGMAR